MSLAFSGPGGTAEHRWLLCALMSDNVLHHLQEGRHGPSFVAVHAAVLALGGRVTLDARQLGAELTRAAQLLKRPIAELAISSRTRAVVENTWPPPRGGEAATTVVGAAASPWLPQAARTLNDVFGNVVRSLQQITAHAAEGDVVEVQDT